MKSIDVRRMHLRDQAVLDDWFDEAMDDETVRPYLTTGQSFPTLTVPEYHEEGAVFMDTESRGVVKIYMEPESRTAKLGIWVLSGDKKNQRGVIAYHLVERAIEWMENHGGVHYVGVRTMSSNDEGMIFAERMFVQWGIENHAVMDTSRLRHVQTNTWVHWIHYRISLVSFKGRMDDWNKINKERYGND